MDVFFSFLARRHCSQRSHLERNGKTLLQLGKIDVELHADFKLFLLCRRSNPKFNAKIYSNAIIINFNITFELLENRMLHIIFETSDKQSTEERVSVATAIAHNHRRLGELEDGLLTQIALGDGNFIDNPDSMKLLLSTKNEIRQIDAQLLDQKNVFMLGDTKRNDFRWIAQKAAGLFNALADMMTIGVFYQHHINDFVEIFEQQIIGCVQQWSAADVRLSSDRYVAEMISDLNKRIYHFGSMGMMASDKLIFSLRLAMELELCDAKLNHKEIEFLFKPAAAAVAAAAAGVETTVTTINPMENCFSEWLSQEQYMNVYLLATTFPHTFDNLLTEISENVEKWRTWHRSPQPETNIDSIWCGTNLTNFQVIFISQGFQYCRYYIEY